MERSHQAAIVVVTYNSEHCLAPCLVSLERQRHSGFAILVIDNASTDGTVSLIRSRFPSILLHENRENLGFSEGCNQGISLALRAGASDICLLNPDAEADPDWLEKLIAARRSDTQAGIIQSKIYQKSVSLKTLNSSGNREHYLGFAYCGQNGCEETADLEEIREIAFASGGACLITREVIERIGGFDPTYFMYHEDVDLGQRARLSGFKVLYAPDAIAWHDYTFERGGWKYYLLERNRLRTFFKNDSGKTILLLLPMLLVTELAVLFQASRKRWFLLKIKSYLTLLRDLPKLIRKRRRVQSLRRVPDREIIQLFTDRIDQPELSGPGLALLNHFWRAYWRVVKRWI